MNIYQQQYVRAATINIFGFLIAVGLMLQWVIPQLEPLWITEKVVATIQQQAPTAISATKPLLSIGYDEPSLVFMTGTKKIIFTTADAALKSLQQNQSELILITQALQTDFINSASLQGIHLQNVTTIRGFNYSRGKWVTVSLYKRLQVTGDRNF